MKRKTYSNLSWLYMVLFFVILVMIPSSYGVAQTPVTSKDRIVSYVDTSLDGSQKFVLRVDGKPFYMTNIQIRLDKLRYWWNWDTAARDAIVARAAEDGFNTVSIPIQWYEVESVKDKFDWTILDEYLGLVQKYNLKMELLWFGQNSGGQVQWLGYPMQNPVHLRTPDYVLYSSSPISKSTTSEYQIRRDMSDYTLDLADNKLKERETYVLGKVMEHIAFWDKAHGSKHTVIGVQINNEVNGNNGIPFPASLITSYMSDIASAIKKSTYIVWTRMNCIPSLTNSIIEANEALRSSMGTNIDFVGIDIYGNDVNTVRTSLPNIGKNYKMIMESGAEVSNAAQFQVAALAGDNAYDHYEICGPDEHGPYMRTADNRFTPRGIYVEDIRLVNKIIASDMVDIAINANGKGLFVHNWEGINTGPSEGAKGIIFTPGYPTSQGISIIRSTTEVVLMTTKGGKFTLPDSIDVSEISKGYFDGDNNWVNEGNVPIITEKYYFRSASNRIIILDPGSTVLLTVK